MSTRGFKSKVTVSGSRVFVPIPFDPNEAWGTKQRHHISGMINGHTIRGSLGSDGASYFLPLGAAWRRDAAIVAGEPVTVTLSPEGPQQADMAPDIAAVLATEPGAKAISHKLRHS